LIGNSHGLILRYYPGIRLERLRKTTETLNQDSQSPEPRIKPGTFQIQSRSVNHLTTTFSTTMGDATSFHFMSPGFSFKAYAGSVQNFKKKHQVRQRHMTKYISSGTIQLLKKQLKVLNCFKNRQLQ
jgi:hypothetical protein